MMIFLCYMCRFPEMFVVEAETGRPLLFSYFVNLLRQIGGSFESDQVHAGNGPLKMLTFLLVKNVAIRPMIQKALERKRPLGATR